MSSWQLRRCLLLRRLHRGQTSQYGVSTIEYQRENIPKTATRPFAPGVLAKAAFVERIEAIPTIAGEN